MLKLATNNKIQICSPLFHNYCQSYGLKILLLKEGERSSLYPEFDTDNVGDIDLFVGLD